MLAIFTVTAVRTYARSQFPVAMVYAVPDAELRLITCGGTPGHAKRQLSQQCVVYAQLSG
jgi:hypothetical protein